MVLNMYLSTTKSKNQEQSPSRTEKTDGYREHFDSCQMGGGWRMG